MDTQMDYESDYESEYDSEFTSPFGSDSELYYYDVSDTEEGQENVIRNVTENRTCSKLNPLQILDSMNVIDKQNLVTTYVMACYNLLYNTGDCIGHLLVTQNNRRLIRRPTPTTVPLPRTTEKRLWHPSVDPRIPDEYENMFSLITTGPTDWNVSLFTDKIETVLTMEVTPKSVCAIYKMMSVSNPINDEVEEAQNEILGPAAERRAILRGEIVRPQPIYPDNADVLVNNLIDSPVSVSSQRSTTSTDRDICALPIKRYTVHTETTNALTRDIDVRSVISDSIVSFGFSCTTEPEPETEDIECETRIKVSTVVHYYQGLCILGSVTQMETRQTHGNTVKRFYDQSPCVSLTQPMNREFAELVMDGIATNYSAVIQIIGLALLLYFANY